MIFVIVDSVIVVFSSGVASAPKQCGPNHEFTDKSLISAILTSVRPIHDSRWDFFLVRGAVHGHREPMDEIC